jgi:plastocyanin
MTVARRLALVASFLGVLALVGLAAFAATAVAANGDVSIAGKAFEPATITVLVGDTVTWTVTESINEPHSVTSGTPEDAGRMFDSGTGTGANFLLRDNGQTFEHTFGDPGEFLYFCTVHPSDMTGKVLVLAPGASPPPAVEPPPSEAHTGVPTERKALAAGILGIALVLMFAGAWLWRRMNPA